MIFPTLYNKIRRGSKVKDVYWTIVVEQSDTEQVYIHIESGDVGGKPKKTTLTVSKGKNIGKKNETTAYEQACKDAKSRWTKKRKVYSEDKNAIPSFYPMIIDRYPDHKSKLKWPVYVQPKLDGIRAVAELGTLKRKEMTPFKYQSAYVADLEELTNRFGDEVIIDGELYSQEMPLQRIAGIMNRSVSKPENTSLIFNIFDIFDKQNPKMPFSERWNIIKDVDLPTIKAVKTTLVHNEDEVEKYLQKYLDAGFEGIVLRNGGAAYKPSKLTSGRTRDVLKYKIFTIEEYEIVDIVETPSTSTFGILIHVRMPNGATFPITGNGTKEYQAKILSARKEYIGKKIRFEFNGTTEDGVPKFCKPILNSGEYVIV